MKVGAPDPKVPARFAYITRNFRMLENTQIATNFSLIVGHGLHPPSQKEEIFESVSLNRTTLQIAVRRGHQMLESDN
jgi:hypothetical protein